ncbi:MAG: TetR family transcriptional regulator [Streptosporangiales bacterium]|nr:TetR family transcriptional regulator [Streptosporangiales bacterium]
MTQAARTGRTRRPRRDTARRRIERAERILDAAAELVVRWGYDKTTVDDVARRAGVAKGTIYLHWASREDLFAVLLRRERTLMVAEVRDLVRADPASATPQGVFAHLARELLRRPLLRGVLTGDPVVLGKLAHMKRTSTTTTDMVSSFEEYLGTLRRHGLVRDDLSLADHVTIVGAVLYGSLVSTPLMPEPYRVSDERVGELIGDALERTLSTGRHPTAAERRTCEAATLEFLDRAHETAQRKLGESLGATTTPEGGASS